MGEERHCIDEMRHCAEGRHGVEGGHCAEGRHRIEEGHCAELRHCAGGRLSTNGDIPSRDGIKVQGVGGTVLRDGTEFKGCVARRGGRHCVKGRH